MKKSVFLLALIAVISCMLYAQELKFDGYLNSGVGVISDDNGDSAPRLKVYGIDSEQNGFRFRLNGTYTNEAKNAGIRFRLQAQAGLTTASRESVSLPYLYGWVGFFDNILTLSGGIIEDNAWQTGDWWLASDSVNHFAGLGALVKITPVEGLVLGAGAQPIARTGGSNNNALAMANYGTDVKWDKVRYSGHAAYTMKDMFRLGFSYRSESESGGSGENSSIAYGEFRFLGLKDLTAVAAASMNNLGEDFSDAGQIIISETFGYKINNLNLGLNAVQFLFNNDADTGLLFNLWTSYTINSVIPRLDLVYFMGGNSTLMTTAETWQRKGFAASGNEDISVFSIRPSVRFQLDNRTHLEIGDMFNMDMVKDADNTLSNVFYIDLRWNF